MRNFFLRMMAVILILLPAGQGLAAESVGPSVLSLQVENGKQSGEYRFSAELAGVDQADGRYRVLLELAQTNGDFSPGEAALLTPMAWEPDSKRWVLTKTVERFGRDKTRQFRVVVREQSSGANASVSEIGSVYAPGKAAPISLQEAREFLGRLAQTYSAKNHKEFMNLVSPDFAGDDFLLSNALRKDFQYLDDISLRFSGIGVASANSQFASITTGFRRSVTSIRTGQRYNDSGITEMALIKEKGQLKLYSMKKPLLFGLSNDGNTATGIVASEQNRAVTQLRRDGTIFVGPVASQRPQVRSIVLRGRDLGMGPSVEGLAIPSNSKTYGNEVRSAISGSFSGDITLIRQGIAPLTYICFTGTGVRLTSATSINSVTTVPESGYSSGSITVGTPLPEPLIFAIRLTNGRYAVVQFTNTMGSETDWQTTVLYKYQQDGTRNF